MFTRLKDATGATVLVNTGQILFIGAAADAQTKRAILGQSVIQLTYGVAVSIAMSPDQIAEILCVPPNLSKV